MAAKLLELPPLKRFRAIQQQEQAENLQEAKNNISNSSLLPAKKRKLIEEPPFLSDQIFPSAAATTTTPCLPAKKRIWALAPFDLNLEYSPTFEPASDENQGESEMLKDGLDNKPQHKEGKTEKGFDVVDALKAKGTAEDQQKNQTRRTRELTPSVVIPSNDVDVDPDDDGIVCAVCESTDGDPSDPIVLCDGCDLMVHTTCYGNPLTNGVPEGDWFCAQCLESKSPQSKAKNHFSCCLCPVKGGALKPTNNGQWAHIVCALLVPEVFFTDPEGRQGIDCSRVPQRRRERRCYVCKSRKGCAIDCSEPKCPLGFHVTCGLKEELCIEYTEGRSKGSAIVAGFCKTHTDLWKKQQQTGKFKIVARDDQKK